MNPRPKTIASGQSFSPHARRSSSQPSIWYVLPQLGGRSSTPNSFFFIRQPYRRSCQRLLENSSQHNLHGWVVHMRLQAQRLFPGSEDSATFSAVDPSCLQVWYSLSSEVQSVAQRL